MDNGNLEQENVTIVGGGAWGTTLAMLADRAGSRSTLYVRDPDVADVMRERRIHPRSLPGVSLPAAITIESDIGRALEDADVVILAIPTQKLRAALEPMASLLASKVVTSAAKGIEVGTLKRPSGIITEALGRPDTPVAVISGPNLSGEIAAGKPATTVVASKDANAALRVQRALMSETFRVYTSDDVVGVELGGALKNIIAIGAGIGDGMSAGDNAKAAFLTRGIAEISRLGVACGAQPLTFAGLSGIGDLIATCSSSLSRNHQVGAGLAAGKSLDEVLQGMTETAEGVQTTRAAVAMARECGVEMPIAEQLARVLFEGLSPVEAIRALMVREPRSEAPGEL